MESELFEGLDPQEKSSFLALFDHKKIDKETTIKKEGEKLEGAFFLLDGEVSVRKRSSDEEMEVASIQGGEDLLFSLDSLVDGGPSLTTVIATRPSTILEIDRQAFWEFCRNNPAAGAKVLENLTIRLVQILRKSDEKVAEMYKTLEEVL